MSRKRLAARETLPLKLFQIDTVDEIVRRITKPDTRLALADEVGLGKTYVMAETCGRLVKNRDFKVRTIYYVAPSREVADANVGDIASACGTFVRSGQTSKLRITLLPVTLDESSGVRVIPLSARTSFDLRGTGDRRERAFLYAIFRQLRKMLRRRGGAMQRQFMGDGYCISWAEIFFRPRRRNGTRAGYEITSSYIHWRSIAKQLDWIGSAAKIASALARDDVWKNEIIPLLEAQAGEADREKAYKASAKIISRFRLHVARKVLTDKFGPDIVLLDEWHKYKEFLIGESVGHLQGEQLLAEALHCWKGEVKDGRVPLLTLFVSATPFEVKLDNTRGATASGLEDLCKVMRNEKFWEKVNSQREAYVDATTDYQEALIARRENLSELKRKCEDQAGEFSKLLSEFMVRTERPHGNQRRNEPDDLTENAWSRARIRSLAGLQRFVKSRKGRDVGTDIVALWHSSSHFPRMIGDPSYEIGTALMESSPEKARSYCLDGHWKRDELKKLLRVGLTGKHIKSSIIPPLWIPALKSRRPLSRKEERRRLAMSKVLIFSQWAAVPKEICHFLGDQADLWKIRRSPKKSSNALGRFPFDVKGSRLGQDSGKTGWTVFYPFLFQTQDRVSEFMKWLDRKALAAEVPRRVGTRHLTQGDGWAAAVVCLDLAYAEFAADESFRLCAEKRACLLNLEVNDWISEIQALGGYRLIMDHLKHGKNLGSLPGAFLARALLEGDDKTPGFSIEHVLSEDAQEFMFAACKAIVAYFNRGFCQQVVQMAAGVEVEKKNDKRPYIMKLLRYMDKNDWESTVYEFIGLLRDSGGHGVAKILQKFATAMSFRTYPGRGAWAPKESWSSSVVQPFVETKTESQFSPESDDDDEAVLSTSRRVDCFNSPFLPHVLVSTSLGQEGLNMHRYCDTVIHWNPPSSPLALEQREGRIDRYRALQIRKALIKNRKANLIRDDEISPDFCVVYKGKRLNHPKARVLVLPFSREEKVWRRCRQRLYYFRMLIGAPDAKALEARLLEKMKHLRESEQKRIFRAIAEIKIELKPNGQSSKRSTLTKKKAS